jgi:hypothetical protein
MYSDSSLTALVAVASMKAVWSRFQYGCRRLFQLSKARWALDKLSFSGDVHMSREHGRFISDFIEDHNRSGMYALNGHRYAMAAVYFLKYIQNHWEQITPSSWPNIYRKYKRQRSTPWLLRRTVNNARSSEAAQIIRWQAHNGTTRLDAGLFIAEHAFHLALKCLAHVLPRSESSKELTVLAHQLKFAPLSRKDTRKKSAVRREIARYLARVE